MDREKDEVTSRRFSRRKFTVAFLGQRQRPVASIVVPMGEGR